MLLILFPCCCHACAKSSLVGNLVFYQNQFSIFLKAMENYMYYKRRLRVASARLVESCFRVARQKEVAPIAITVLASKYCPSASHGHAVTRGCSRLRCPGHRQEVVLVPDKRRLGVGRQDSFRLNWLRINGQMLTARKSKKRSSRYVYLHLNKQLVRISFA